MSGFDMKFDDSLMAEAAEALGSSLAAAMKKSLLRGGTAGRQEIVGPLSSLTGLPVAKCRAAIKVKLVRGDQANLELSRKPIPLIQFGAKGPAIPSKGKGKGITYRTVGGGRGVEPHAFFARMPSGHVGVFEKKTTSTHQYVKGKGTTELPIQELPGPSIVPAFEELAPRAAERAHEMMAKTLRDEIAFALSRRRK